MRKDMVLGVDLGWVSQLESRGIKWVDDNKNGIDPIQAVKEKGATAIRLRVFVNPPEIAYWQKNDGSICMLGFANAKSVLEMAKRVKKAEMDLMIDFHYSDHFADPQYQDTPEAWKEEELDGLKKRVFDHTTEVLNLLATEDIYPKWVQVGNEINLGVLWPTGSLREAPENMVELLNAGYEAVKTCCPECKVITHLSAVQMKGFCTAFLDAFFKYGGKTDILGFSHYPYWFKLQNNTPLLEESLQFYAKRYQKPVMICEVGGPEIEADGTYQLLRNTIRAIENIENEQGCGVFYWEPEVGARVLPDQYPLGAASLVGDCTLQFTKALDAYKEYNK